MTPVSGYNCLRSPPLEFFPWFSKRITHSQFYPVFWSCIWSTAEHITFNCILFTLSYWTVNSLKISYSGTSLVAQWLRICLPMQGTRVRALVWEDPTCRGATRPVSHSYWACTLEPVLRNKRGRDSERPAHRDEEWPPLATTGESPRTETKIQHSQK